MLASLSLGEGRTPLIPSRRIGPSLGATRLMFKIEGGNPSGSYKDRFAASQVGWMLEQGAPACVATSSGNTGAALAAYAARAALPCYIVVTPDIPAGKLTQMQAHGAHVLAVPEFVTSPAVTETVFGDLASLAREANIPLVVSAYKYSPEGMAGVESLGVEIVEQAPEGVDHVFVPVGGGGLFAAVCRGIARAGGKARVHAVQPAGCSTVVAAFERGDDEIRPVQAATKISGLSVPTNIDGSLALGLLRERGGRGVAVTDEEIYRAQGRLFAEEGVNVEPAGATALAGFLKAWEQGWIGAGERCVCVATGHGFKDPAAIARLASSGELPLVAADSLSETIRGLAKGNKR